MSDRILRQAEGRRRFRSGRAQQSLSVEIQFATSRRGVPHPRRLRVWVEQAFVEGVLPYSLQPYSLVLRIVGAAEGRQLNRDWRGRDKPTNVLSFPAGDSPPAIAKEVLPLGDIVLCAPVIHREAHEQAKAPQAHWAHMVVHGILHLAGYDHEVEREALAMEHLETEILGRYGFPDPYL